MSIRVLLVDDQELVRSGFSAILSANSDPGQDVIEVVGEAEDGASAIAAVAELDPDVVCMDVQMPGIDGLEATRRIVASDARAAVLVLTTFDSDDYLFRALEAGASGFLLKTARPQQLTEAVRVLASGEALLSPAVTRRVIERFGGSAPGGASAPGAAGGAPAPTGNPTAPGFADLTDREAEVLGLVARGLSNSEIASELVVGEATVKTHVSSVLLKLEVRDRVQAVVRAYESGFVTRGD